MVQSSQGTAKYLMQEWQEMRARALIDKTQFTDEELAWLEMTDTPYPSPDDREQYLVETQPLDPLTEKSDYIDRRTISPQMGDKDVT